MQIIRNGELVDATTEEAAEIAALQEASKPSQQDYAQAVQSVIDEAARSRQFNDGVTLASYKDSTIPAWAAQATTLIAWRDAVWAYAYAQLAAVQAGQRAQPTVAEILAELPAITWPA